jgi:uncharacterized protein YdeI (YjbR/CyaY-like superfamily)
VKFFDSAAAFRAWLKADHAKRTELWLGFYKRHTGKKSISYPQALDEALCYGWIDGVRRSVDAERYTIRFTPRKARSYWSAVNLRHARRLRKQGRIARPGLDVLLAGDRARANRYSFEKRRRGLSPKSAQRVKASRKAWAFFSAQAPWYRRTAGFWIESAEREDTRERRLAQLIADSQAGRRIGVLNVGKSESP